MTADQQATAIKDEANFAGRVYLGNRLPAAAAARTMERR